MNDSTTQQPNTSPTPANGLHNWVGDYPQGLPVGMADRIAWLRAVEAGLRPPLPDVAPPCPWWCQQAEQHPFDAGMSTMSALMRFHEAEFASPAADPYAVAVVQAETAALDGISCVQREAPLVMVYGDLEDVTAAQSRALGEAFTKAADLMDRIAAGARR